MIEKKEQRDREEDRGINERDTQLEKSIEGQRKGQ